MSDPTALDLFRAWLANELRDAGCEIRALSPEGMAKVTVERFTREGWVVVPPITPQMADPLVDGCDDRACICRCHEVESEVAKAERDSAAVEPFVIEIRRV